MSLSNLSSEDIRRHAKKLDFNLSDDEVELFTAALPVNIDAYAVLDNLEDEVLAPQYPRGAFYHPNTDEDPLNGWATKVTVKGASTGPLAGVTIALKDNICLAGVPLLNGTNSMKGYLPDSDATVVTRILDAGGTISGKAQCEFLSASGGSHTSVTGYVRNPHDTNCSAGGSSSGCAVLVANGDVDMAVGGDQGGSVRVPASFCGIVGMKPTHGLIPYTAVIPVDPTLDHLGPMTRNVTDNAKLLSVIAGVDGLDPRQKNPQVNDYLSEIDTGVNRFKIGIIKEGFGHPDSEASVDEIVRSSALELTKLGAIVEDITIPIHELSPSAVLPITCEGVYRTIVTNFGLPTLPRGFYPVDLLDKLADWRQLNSDMPVHAKLIMILAEHMNEPFNGRYYAKAQNLGRKIGQAYDKQLEEYDVLIMPTTRMKAPQLPKADAPLGELLLRGFDSLSNTAIFNVTGHPALSLPCGKINGLPVGLMMIGAYHNEAKIYRIAKALETYLSLDLSLGGMSK